MKEILHVDKKGNHLMTIEKVDTGISNEIFENAFQELFDYEQKHSEDACVWGYFPDFKEDQLTYTACNILEEKMHAVIPNYMELSFIKLASSKPQKEYGGLHLDDKVGTEKNNDLGRDILRILINLHPSASRFLKYAVMTGDELRQASLDIPIGEYTPIELPEGFETKIIEIPPRKGNVVSMVTFLANRVPHVGVTDENGYFLMGYGAYVNDYNKNI